MKKRWLRVLGDKSHRNDSSFSCKPPEYWSIRSMTTGLLHGFVWIPRKRKKLSLTSLNKWLKESRHQRREWIYIVLCSNSITLLVWWVFHQEVRRRNEKRQRKRIQMKKKKKKKRVKSAFFVCVCVLRLAAWSSIAGSLKVCKCHPRPCNSNRDRCLSRNRIEL